MKTTNKELLESFDLKGECEKCKEVFYKKDLVDELLCKYCFNLFLIYDLAAPPHSKAFVRIDFLQKYDDFISGKTTNDT